MKKFRVELIFETGATAENDTSIYIEVYAQDEVHALNTAKEELGKEHPDFNFMKVWAWNIQNLDGISPRSEP